MNHRHLTVIIAVMAMAVFSACSGYKERTLNYLGKRPTTGPFFQQDDTPLVELNYKAGNKIASLLSQRLPIGSPITVRIFNLRGSSLVTDFAKISTEQVASRIAQEGFAVVADDSGYPMLSPEEGMPDPVRCILAGAYTVGPKKIYLTAAVTTVADGEIIGSWDWTVPLNHNTRALLPLDQDNDLKPMVKTTGPYEKPKSSSSAETARHSTQNNTQPGFEQNIID